MKKLYTFLIIPALASIFLACDNNEEDIELERQKQIDNQLISDYLSDNNISAEKDEYGIYFEKLAENPAGEAVALEDILEVYYRITTLDGRILEAKLAENSQPIKFRHAQGGLYPVGINIGAGYMRTGEKYRFYIPSYLGLESFANNSIAPYSVLVAEVELVNILNNQEQFDLELDSIKSVLNARGITGYEQFSNGLIKYTVQTGTGSLFPGNNSQILAVLRRKYLDDTETRLPSDNGDDLTQLTMGLHMTNGLEMGLSIMVEGEKAEVFVPSYLAFDSYTQVLPIKFRSEFLVNYLGYQNLAPFAILKYEIEIKDIN
ncbi:MAG: FKBP-type peptidyl-prolyl cis-trans isomerase [Cyclobacteriaceae bacterium]